MRFCVYAEIQDGRPKAQTLLGKVCVCVGACVCVCVSVSEIS